MKFAFDTSKNGACGLAALATGVNRVTGIYGSETVTVPATPTTTAPG